MNAEFRSPIDPDRKPLQELLPLNEPLSLYIDVCDLCNFQCDFCFQKHVKIKGRTMEEELFRKIVNDMKVFEKPFKMVNLYGCGEPLINIKTPDFVKMLKKEEVAETVRILTNGSLLTPQMSERLIEAGLDKISFSIYGLNDMDYKKFSQARMSFQELLDNIRYFYSIRGKCEMHIKIAGDYFNDEQKKFFLELFGEISDTIYIDNATNVWPELHVVEEKANHHIFGMQVEKRICPMPFYQMYIHSDGVVSSCCVDYDKKVVMGNVNTESIKDIWNGFNYQKLRRDILKNNLKDGTRCRKCEYPVCGATVDITPYKEELLEKYCL